MSGEMHLYTFEDAEGHESGYSTTDYRDAKDYAIRGQLRIIDNTYEWADSEVAEDFTSGERIW